MQQHTPKVPKDMRPFDAYGYLWWIDNGNKSVWADGSGGQFLMINSDSDLALYQRNFTDNSLIWSGLFMMMMMKDDFRDELMYIYNNIKLSIK